MVGRVRDFNQPIEVPSHRLDDKSLASVAEQPDLVPTRKPIGCPTACLAIRKNGDYFSGICPWMMVDYWERQQHSCDKLNRFLRDEGVLAVLRNDTRGAGGTVFNRAASSRSRMRRSRRPPSSLPGTFQPPLAPGRKSVPVELKLELARHSSTRREPRTSSPRFPAEEKGEVVMLRAHVDSWRRHGRDR
jgi:hypothetical protein